MKHLAIECSGIPCFCFIPVQKTIETSKRAFLVIIIITHHNLTTYTHHRQLSCFGDKWEVFGAYKALSTNYYINIITLLIDLKLLPSNTFVQHLNKKYTAVKCGKASKVNTPIAR